MPDEKTQKVFAPECGDLVCIVVAVIFTGKCYFCSIYFQYPVVGNGRTMSIASNIIVQQNWHEYNAELFDAKKIRTLVTGMFTFPVFQQHTGRNNKMQMGMIM